MRIKPHLATFSAIIAFILLGIFSYFYPELIPPGNILVSYISSGSSSLPGYEVSTIMWGALVNALIYSIVVYGFVRVSERLRHKNC